jgi:hypothetical protein
MDVAFYLHEVLMKPHWIYVVLRTEAGYYHPAANY